MKPSTWTAWAPSNIALIKYMGKTDHTQNQPINDSLSYTLDNLKSHVELELYNGPHDIWKPLDSESKFLLPQKSQDRFLKHLHFLKGELGFQGNFIVRSKNNFPFGCGLASSASSFAALTYAAEKAIRGCVGEKAKPYSRKQLSLLSQRGSGSSCRSFFRPWSVWSSTGASALDLPYKNLYHQVVITDEKEKKVSSGVAHQRVSSSALFAGRAERAQNRKEELINNFQSYNWQRAFEICWEEFWDMHALFRSSNPSFSYITPDSKIVLKEVYSYWIKENDGPLITMDAGPNVHLLYRPDQKHVMEAIRGLFGTRYLCFSNIEMK